MKKTTQLKTVKNKKVIIEVNGGVAYVNWDLSDEGVEVEIIDHDND